MRQLDNDVQSIYELVMGISLTQVRHGNRLNELDVRFDQVDSRFDEVLDALRGGRGPGTG